MLAQRRQVAGYYYGDYYPLTSYHTEDDAWMAWQFNQPEEGAGMVQAFRRPLSPAITMQFRLRGLDRKTQYVVMDLDRREATVHSGAALMSDGLTISLPHRRSAAILSYKRQE